MVDKWNNIKLLDFSTAKILGENGFIEEGTDKFFNPHHCSPEQFFQKEYYLNSDVWMLGSIFHEMMNPGDFMHFPLDSELFGEEKNDWSGIWKAITFNLEEETPHKPIPEIYGDDLSELLDSMLDYNPYTRPSMTQIADRIRKINAQHYHNIFTTET